MKNTRLLIPVSWLIIAVGVIYLSLHKNVVDISHDLDGYDYVDWNSLSIKDMSLRELIENFGEPDEKRFIPTSREYSPALEMWIESWYDKYTTINVRFLRYLNRCGYPCINYFWKTIPNSDHSLFVYAMQTEQGMIPKWGVLISQSAQMYE